RPAPPPGSTPTPAGGRRDSASSPRRCARCWRPRPPGPTTSSPTCARSLRRLVSRGARGEEAIDAELSRDATDAGERHAASCRAAIPTLTAKRETWETLTDGKLTIAMFRATISGFTDPDQPELVQPYRPEFFAALGEVWRDWSSAMAQNFVEY